MENLSDQGQDSEILRLEPSSVRFSKTWERLDFVQILTNYWKSLTHVDSIPPYIRYIHVYMIIYIIIYAVYRSIHSMQLHLLSLDTVYMCLHMRRCWDCKHMQDVRCVWIYIYELDIEIKWNECVYIIITHVHIDLFTLVWNVAVWCHGSGVAAAKVRTAIATPLTKRCVHCVRLPSAHQESFQDFPSLSVFLRWRFHCFKSVLPLSSNINYW